jgi:hypothetical protein
MSARVVRYVRRHHLGLLALFVALGGTSYAATALPRDSVGSRQLRDDAVSSSKVKDGTLRSKDFKASDRSELRGARGPAGPVGAAGATGPGGPAGPAGSPGPHATADVRFATTESKPSGSTSRVDYHYAIENRGPDATTVALQAYVGHNVWAYTLPTTGAVTCTGTREVSGGTVLLYGNYDCMVGQVEAGQTVALDLTVYDCGQQTHSTSARIISSATDPTPGDQATTSSVIAVSCAG